MHSSQRLPRQNANKSQVNQTVDQPERKTITANPIGRLDSLHCDHRPLPPPSS